MGALGRKLRSASGRLGHKQLLHWCPGCDGVHGIQIAGPDGPTWTFNGDHEAPSFSPSILCYTTHDDEGDPLPPGQRRTLCHYFIKAGKIEFCGDSPHRLAGQTVDLPDWPYEPGTYGGIDDESGGG